MHSMLSWLAIESWKPWLTALLLPPVPLLMLLLISARNLLPRAGRPPRWGWLVVLVVTAGLWLTACSGFARALEPLLLRATPAISAERLSAMRAEARLNAGDSAGGRTTAQRTNKVPIGKASHHNADGSEAAADTAPGPTRNDRVAIVVMGSGVEAYAPEYGRSSLSASSLERLRYGVWLGRETGWPVAFSGGLGWGNRSASGTETPEANIAARIAADEFGRPLRWLEAESRDTRENAARSLALLHAAGVRHLVLVTHGWHMPRVQARFDAEAAARYPDMRIDTAPMGLALDAQPAVLAWLPSSGGFQRVRLVLREWLGTALHA